MNLRQKLSSFFQKTQTTAIEEDPEIRVKKETCYYTIGSGTIYEVSIFTMDDFLYIKAKPARDRPKTEPPKVLYQMDILNAVLRSLDLPQTTSLVFIDNKEDRKKLRAVCLTGDE